MRSLNCGGLVAFKGAAYWCCCTSHKIELLQYSCKILNIRYTVLINSDGLRTRGDETNAKYIKNTIILDYGQQGEPRKISKCGAYYAAELTTYKQIKNGVEL